MLLQELYYMTICIVGIGLTIKALELIESRQEFEKGRSFDWVIVGKDELVFRESGFFAKIYSKQGTMITCVLLIIFFALSVFSQNFNPVNKIFLAVFILLNLLIYTRNSYGLDGADQMAQLILLATLISFVLASPANYDLGLYFIAAQLCLSYIISGGAKLISPQWRSGKAIQGILSTHTYGNSFARKLLLGRNTLSLIFCWGVILFEILFPLLLFFDTNIVLIGIAAGMLFHLSIAITMGLNDFFWSFSAAYPAFYFTSQRIAELM